MANGVIGEASIVIGADASNVGADIAKKAERPAAAGGQRLAAALNKSLTNGLRASAASAANALVKPLTDRIQSGLGAAAERGGAALRKMLGPDLSNSFGRFLTQLTDAETRSKALAGAGQAIRDSLVRATGPIGRFAVGFTDARAAASSFTGVMGSLGGIARKAWDVATGAARSFGSGVKSVFDKVASIASAAWQKVRDGAARAFAAVSRTMKDTLVAGARVAGAAAGATVGAALVKGFGRLEAIDTAEAKLTGLGHSTRDIAKIMQAATGAVKGTAFGLGEAASAAAQFSAAGVPLSGMQRSLSILASASAVAGADMSEMTTIFGKVAATGKLNGEVVQQLAERGIPVLSLLAKQYGISGEAAQKMVSEGKVDFEAFQTVIEGSLGPAAAAMGLSFRGMLSNVGAALGRLGATAQKPIFESLKIVMPGLISALDAMNAALAPLADVLLPKLEGGAQRVADFLGKINFSTTAEGANSFLSALGPLLPLLGAAAGALGPLLSGLPVIGGLFAGITGRVGLFAGALIALLAIDPQTLLAGFDSIAAALPGIISSLVNMLVTVVPQIVTRLATSIPVFINGILSLLSSLIPAIATALPTIVSAIAQLIPQVVSALLSAAPILLANAVTLLISIVEAVPVVLPQVISALLQLLPQLISTLLGMLPTLLTTGINLFLSLVESLVTVVPQVVTQLLDMLPSLVDTLLGMIPTLISTGIDLFIKLVDAFVTALPQIISAVMGMLPKIISTLVGMIPKLLNAGIKLFVQLVEALPVVIPKIIDALIKLAPVMVDALISLVPQLIQAGIDIIGGLVQGLWNAAASVGAALLKIAQDAIGSFLNFLGINSPSKLFATFGKFVGQGFIKGIDGTKSGVEKSIMALKDKTGALFDGLKADRNKALDRLDSYNTSLRRREADHERKIDDLQARYRNARTDKARASIAKQIADENRSYRRRTTDLKKQIAEQKAIVASTSKALTKGNRAAINALISQANRDLRALAGDREKLVARLEVAQADLANAIKLRDDFRSKISQGVAGLFDITEVDKKGRTSAQSMIDRLKAQIATTQAFRETIKRLTDMGLDDASIADLTESFASTGKTTAADALLAGGPEAVAELARLRGELAKEADGLGSSVANSLYQAGVDSAKGIVDGLKSQIADIDKVMQEIADGLVTAIKQKLGIKSPSRVLADVGVDTMRGYVKGVEGMSGLVDAALSDAVRIDAINVPKAPPAPGAAPAVASSSKQVIFEEGSVVAQGVTDTDVPKLAQETADRTAEKVVMAL